MGVPSLQIRSRSQSETAVTSTWAKAGGFRIGHKRKPRQDLLETCTCAQEKDSLNHAVHSANDHDGKHWTHPLEWPSEIVIVRQFAAQELCPIKNLGGLFRASRNLVRNRRHSGGLPQGLRECPHHSAESREIERLCSVGERPFGAGMNLDD